MTSTYPTSFGNLDSWATTNGIARDEARRRYAQYIVLTAIANSPVLRLSLVFKGGNALDFVLLPNRSTIDLDFSLDAGSNHGAVSDDMLGNQLENGCRRTSGQSGTMLAVHSVRRNPPNIDRDFVTFEARIGYALPDQGALRIRMANGRPSPQVIPVEISINEPICDSTEFSPGPDIAPLRISTLEDIVSEKLRALLQQSIRDRQRPQDLLDIAVILQANTGLDLERVAAFLLIKAAARAVPVSRRSFHHPELRRRARIGYNDLEVTTRTLFLPFDQALATVLGFVDALPIPDQP